MCADLGGDLGAFARAKLVQFVQCAVSASSRTPFRLPAGGSRLVRLAEHARKAQGRVQIRLSARDAGSCFAASRKALIQAEESLDSSRWRRCRESACKDDAHFDVSARRLLLHQRPNRVLERIGGSRRVDLHVQAAMIQALDADHQISPIRAAASARANPVMLRSGRHLPGHPESIGD